MIKEAASMHYILIFNEESPDKVIATEVVEPPLHQFYGGIVTYLLY